MCGNTLLRNIMLGALSHSTACRLSYVFSISAGFLVALVSDANGKDDRHWIDTRSSIAIVDAQQAV